MADTTYFVFIENSPLNNPDNGSNPITGFVSSNKIPSTSPGDGEYRPDQALDLSNCTSLSEKTTNTGGREILVSWLIRSTVNEYGATRLVDKNWTPDPVEISGNIADYWLAGQEIDNELTISGGTGIYTNIVINSKPLWLTVSLIDNKIIFSGIPTVQTYGIVSLSVTDHIGTVGEWEGEYSTNSPIYCGGDVSIGPLLNPTISRIIRYSPNLEIDYGFIPPTTINNTIYSINVDPDGGVVIGGAFTAPATRLMKLTNTGAVDTTFTASANNTVNKIIRTIDDKLLLCGTFTQINSTTRNRIAKLNLDGSLITTWSVANNSSVNDIGELSNGQYMVGGNFSSIGGQSRPNIARLNQDGTVDLTFASVSLNHNVVALVVLSDNSVVIFGGFTTVNGQPRQYCAKLNADGSLSNSYNVTGLSSNIQAAILLPDGSILVSGITPNKIVRLNPIGEIDNEFDIPISSPIQDMVFHQSGDYLLGGGTTTVNGVSVNRLCKISDTGIVDTSFVSGFTNITPYVYALEQYPFG